MRRILAPLAGLAAIALLVGTACTFDQQTVAVQPAQVVVHAVLDPGTLQQEVLVERTLSGTANIPDELRFDPDDPINTGGGIPIGGADVTITGPDGALRGFEAPAPGRPTSYSTGRYIVAFGPGGASGVPPLRRGARYELRVRTSDGAVVTGTTVVPEVQPVGPSSRIDAFNRDRDSLVIRWQNVRGSRSYLVRTETPFGVFLLFTDSTRVTLDGDLRNYFASSLERVFIPGFRQRVTVAAVDSNYFDYYRSRNDPFTGSGIINGLQGGIGLFGSAVNIFGRTLDVGQNVREPSFEGIWDLAAAPRLVAEVLRVYVETPGEPAALSGWYSRNRSAAGLEGMVGTRTDGRIVLQFLANQSAVDTVAVFAGEQRGDSLVGTFVGVPGPVVFRKRP